MKEEIILKALELVIMILSAVFCRYAIPWMKQRLEDDRFCMFARWVVYAVKWAEQVYADKTGAERKDMVLGFLRTLMKNTGIEMSYSELDTLIESAVQTMNSMNMSKLDFGAGKELESLLNDLMPKKPTEEAQ